MHSFPPFQDSTFDICFADNLMDDASLIPLPLSVLAEHMSSKRKIVEISSDGSDSEDDDFLHAIRESKQTFEREAKRSKFNSSDRDAGSFSGSSAISLNDSVDDIEKAIAASKESFQKEQEHKNVVTIDEDEDAQLQEALQLSVRTALAEGSLPPEDLEKHAREDLADESSEMEANKYDADPREAEQEINSTVHILPLPKQKTEKLGDRLMRENSSEGESKARQRLGTYFLHSVVRHIGSQWRSGHYVSDIIHMHPKRATFRDAEELKRAKWRSYDDSRVIEKEWREVNDINGQKTGYLFFFVHSSAILEHED